MEQENYEFTGKLVETWQPESEFLRSAAEHLKQAAQERVDYWSKIQKNSVTTIKVDGIDCMSGVALSQHTDSECPRWVVLLPFIANEHTIKVSRRKEEAESTLKASETIEMIPGNLIILDTHRVHWLDAGPNGPTQQEYENIVYEFTKQRDLRAQKRMNERFAPYFKPHWFLVASTDMSVRPTREQAEEAMVNYLLQNNLKLSDFGFASAPPKM